ncbi:hypothetical protein F0L17_07550 [Streptomyces sp. TRM43335]|uniref:Secreted protein n=1 Tax=Streptomyces taklimakanensis TaxID=2569853 RepID=A0A6G2B9Q6_9ACTN|nr:hypothetical protein [Streptomyces taklimakanensis]MTE18988.1 hypothetical protein [Streptomyces taklimakanensis]
MTGRVRLSVLLAALATAGSAVLAPTTAHADHDGKPTIRELLDKCDNGSDVCLFHPDGPPQTFMGEPHQVGGKVYNCTQDVQRASVGWSDTVGESNSVGVSLSAEYGFAEVFKTSIEVSYNHTWSSSHTDSETTWIEVRPGEVGWVTREAEMQRVGGRYELHFPDRYYGHYYWYAPFEAVGPVPDGNDTKTQHTRAMTDREKAEHCG